MSSRSAPRREETATRTPISARTISPRVWKDFRRSTAWRRRRHVLCDRERSPEHLQKDDHVVESEPVDDVPVGGRDRELVAVWNRRGIGRLGAAGENALDSGRADVEPSSDLTLAETLAAIRSAAAFISARCSFVNRLRPIAAAYDERSPNARRVAASTHRLTELSWIGAAPRPSRRRVVSRSGGTGPSLHWRLRSRCRASPGRSAGRGR